MAFEEYKKLGRILMAFEEYKKLDSRGTKPIVSIWARGLMAFNQSATSLYALDKYKYVVLYFDAEIQKIGIQFTNESKREAYKVTHFRHGGGVSFAAMSFLKFFKIDHKKSKQCDFDYNHETDMFVIDVSELIERTL